MYSKYIDDRQWQGKLKVDGGFGQHTKILEIYASNFSKMPFYLESKLDIPNLNEKFGILVDVKIDSRTSEFSDQIESYYLVIVPTSKFKEFLKFISLIRKHAGIEIEGEFYSIHEDNKYDFPLYKLQFNLNPSTSNQPTYEISTGKWFPDFTKTTKQAGWIDMKEFPEFYIEEDGKLIDGIEALDSDIRAQIEKETKETEARLNKWKISKKDKE